MGTAKSVPDSLRPSLGRIFETVGRGGYLISPLVPALTEDMRDGEHLRWFAHGDFAQLRALIDNALANEDERHVIANNLHAHEMKVLWTLRNRCAEVFGESPYHPFFRENYRPGEDPSTALLRMFKHLQFCGSLNDEETISALARRSLR